VLQSDIVIMRWVLVAPRAIAVRSSAVVCSYLRCAVVCRGVPWPGAGRPAPGCFRLFMPSGQLRAFVDTRTGDIFRGLTAQVHFCNLLAVRLGSREPNGEPTKTGTKRRHATLRDDQCS
jgi:hypothetical protein